MKYIYLITLTFCIACNSLFEDAEKDTKLQKISCHIENSIKTEESLIQFANDNFKPYEDWGDKFISATIDKTDLKNHMLSIYGVDIVLHKSLQIKIPFSDLLNGKRRFQLDTNKQEFLIKVTEGLNKDSQNTYSNFRLPSNGEILLTKVDLQNRHITGIFNVSMNYNFSKENQNHYGLLKLNDGSFSLKYEFTRETEPRSLD